MVCVCVVCMPGDGIMLCRAPAGAETSDILKRLLPQQGTLRGTLSSVQGIINGLASHAINHML